MEGICPICGKKVQFFNESDRWLSIGIKLPSDAFCAECLNCGTLIKVRKPKEQEPANLKFLF